MATKPSSVLSTAAAAALLTVGGAIVSGASADTEISSSTSTALETSTSGNITIDSGGSVALQQASTTAITINSNNYLSNSGTISNTGVSSATGIAIDTSAGNITLTETGLNSSGTIDLTGSGSSKTGIAISGGHTFYGPITISSSSSSSSSTSTAALYLQGDSSTAISLASGTTVTGNMTLGGGIAMNPSNTKTTASNSVIVNLSGRLNGNLYVGSALSGIGGGVTGVEALGGIHACSSDLSIPAGYSCATSSQGAFYNASSIALAGIATASSKGDNPEAGSAVVIGGPIDGGFLNTGPGTASNVTAATISSSGLVSSSSSTPVVLIDASKSTTSLPTIIGPISATLDSIDPGYSFLNRGSITAAPTDANLSTLALAFEGASSSSYICLSSSVDSCSTTAVATTESYTNSAGGVSYVTYQKGGGLLDTGTISATATTNTKTSAPTATAIYIGAYTTVPRLDVASEAVSSSSSTAGTIAASVSGEGEGTAYAVSIATYANVPTIDVSKGASIIASVSTTTTSPDKSIASSSSPFTLLAEAIVDNSNTLKTINNSGTIQAATTTLTAGTNATVSNVDRAIDLSASSIGGIQINNSGRILGDILFGDSGSGDILNVGNITTSNGNPVTGIVNSSSNYAIVAKSIISETAGNAPTTYSATIDFGGGTNQTLHVGSFGYVNAVINTETAGELAIQVDPSGQLYVANAGSSVQASTVNVATGGTIGLAISQANLNNSIPVIKASNSASLSGANVAIQFGSYIAASDPVNPTAQTITLIQAPVIRDTTLAEQNAQLAQATPFLFESPASANIVSGDNGPTSLTLINQSGQQLLQLHLLPRSADATNADGSPGLNLSGDAKKQFSLATAALSTDNELGSAIATAMTVYKTPGVASSGINVAASQQQAQQVFSQFSPDVSGGMREVAVMLTDQATGPVAARQRLLRSYANLPGELTLWGEEFTGQINNKGKYSADGTLNSYKDHGFGFSLGLDSGGPRYGWYGGAFTFYSGDVSQLLPRATKTNTQWYMLTGYTENRGAHVFLDTQLSVSYGDFNETRSITAGSLTRNATSKRPGEMVALGANLGAIYRFLGVEIDPHVSLDGLALREEGYKESNGGSGFDLDVAPYFANSLRSAIGTDIKANFGIFGFDLSPEGRVGYRYDFLQNPVKIKAAFDATGGLSTVGNTMTFVGPDPDRGDIFAGLGLKAGSDSWSVGVNYDWVRGGNGSTTQIGTLSILGRI